MLTRLIASTLLGGLLLAAVPLLAPGQDNKAPADKAVIVVKLPADAELTIEGDATKATGKERRFVTPALRPGVTYSYTFAATWSEKGKVTKGEKKVTFKAGQTVEVVFGKGPEMKDKDKKKADEDKKKKDGMYVVAILKAVKAVEDGKFDDAIKAYDDALKAKPGDKDASDARALAVKARDAKKKADEAKKKADEEKKKADDEKGEKSEVKSRTFDFTYEATVTGLEKGKKAKVWVPVAQDNEAQQVKLLGHGVKGGEEKATGKFTTEKQYGNKTLYVETTPDAGKIHLKLSYRVTRREVKGETGKAMEKEELIKRFLQPDALVPIDGKPLELIKDKDLPDDPMKKARALYDVVNDHLKYSKEGKGWGRGDSVWVCDSKFGNCSDFHSLFISLARSQKLPAKFEMGFPIPSKRGEGAVGGYHCWAFFRPEGKAWVPVDISEANKEPKMKDYFFGNLTEDRVTFTTGRDLTLEPKQSAKAVNFLIYPYVEVGGKEYDQAKIEKKFAFKDVAEKK